MSVKIKRDVRRLRDLAPNCQAINMFGTTETQVIELMLGPRPKRELTSD